MRILAMPNAHSHAFQIALRGAGERPAPAWHHADDFWAWREAMFALARSLTPDSIYDSASVLYREMRAAGYGVVGEFHYVHHQADGTPYDEPNAMAIALALAAREAGLRIVLIPAAYHRGGWRGHDLPPSPGQRRFCDQDVESFLQRVDSLRSWAHERDWVSVAVAAHSLRAVPYSWLEAIAAYAEQHDMPRHVHVAEQRREVQEVLAEHGASPIEVLERAGFLGPQTSLVHAIHVGSEDIERIANNQSIVITCPTTEGNLGDGYFPAMAYRDAGVRLAIGSDSHVRVDPFEEARELDTGSRRERQTRFGLLAHFGDLWSELAINGASSLGLRASPRQLGEARVNLDHPLFHTCPRDAVPYALVASGSPSVLLTSAEPRRP